MGHHQPGISGASGGQEIRNYQAAGALLGCCHGVRTQMAMKSKGTCGDFYRWFIWLVMVNICLVIIYNVVNISKYNGSYGGFHSLGGTPSSLDGFC